MYRPAMFREDRIPVMHALMRRHPLAMLVTAGADGLQANPIPFLVDDVASRAAGAPATAPVTPAFGVLRAHLARANPQVAALRAGAEALVIFQGPQAYVSPTWYPTKQETGKVVPTWNYAVVQARGTPRVMEDPAWLLAQLNALTDAQEARVAGGGLEGGSEGGAEGKAEPAPWRVSDAPEAYIAAQLQAIVGIEIPIVALEGKWKVSQNRPEADRAGVVAGLCAQREARESGAMADLVIARGAVLPA